MSNDYKHKQRALNKGAIAARYNGKCPYPLCEHPDIVEGQDWIAKGPLGWGHTDCVNAKIHYHAGGNHSLCKTTSRQRTTDDWSQVNCKKCLKLEDKHSLILDQEAIATFLHETLGGVIAITIDSEGRDDLVTHWDEKYKTEVAKLTPSQLEILREVEAEVEKVTAEVQDLSRAELKALQKALPPRKARVYALETIFGDIRSQVIRGYVRKIDIAKYRSEQ